MKIGFSSAVCPAWDLETIVKNAKEMGFDGVELRGLQGELHLPLVPSLAAHPRDVQAFLDEQGVELVCLGSSVTLDSKKRSETARQKGILIEFIELAAELGCPFVRMFVGEVQRWDTHDKALARIADALMGLVPVLSRHGVTLLVENGGDFPGSAALWYIIDAIGHPSVQCCWNQCNALMIHERPTNSIPWLGRKIGLVHVCDASFDDDGMLTEYKLPGQGQAEVAPQIEFLRGLAYQGYLVFEWPKLWLEDLPEPESVLPEVSRFLRERLAEKQAVLTAYKADKNAPRFRSLSQAG